MIDHRGFRARDLEALGLAVRGNGPGSFLISRGPNQAAPFIWVGTTDPAVWTSEHITSAALRARS